MDSYHYYKPSGKAPVAGVISSLLVGGIAAAVLACLYITIQWFMPIVYINFLVTLGLGFGVGLILASAIRRGKIRNPAVGGVLGLLCGLIALYVQWALFITLRLNASDGSFFWVSSSFSFNDFIDVLLHPAVMWNLIVQLNELGTFTLKGNTMTGSLLWIVWAIEAATILLIPLLAAANKASRPFSETADSWMDEEQKERRLLYVDDIPGLRAALEAGDYTALAKLREGEADGKQYARVKTYTHPADMDGYIVLENITVSIDKKGKEQEKSVDVLKYKMVTADKLREIF